jgi:drug/metabolite transporter (DMT)-like permease
LAGVALIAISATSFGALAAALLAEPLGPVQLAGGALILGAVVILVRAGQAHRPAPASDAPAGTGL